MMQRIFGNRRLSQIAFLMIFLLLFNVVSGFMGFSTASVFVAPIVAGVITVALSYWIRARLQSRG